MDHYSFNDGFPKFPFQNEVMQYQVHPNNSSHIEEIYQNLPQLNRPSFFPTSYKTQPEQHRQPNMFSQSQKTNIPDKYPYYERTSDRGIVNPLHKRNGDEWGWGHLGGSSHGNSPALSALALLGFMFFLNLIQTSLQNNRQMLAAAALNSTTVGIVAGRNGRMKRETQQVELRLNAKRLEGIHYPQESQRPFDRYIARRSKTRNKELSKAYHSTLNKVHPNSSKAENQSQGESLQSSSLECFQLIACKLGRSIFDSLDTTTGLVVRMFGASVIPRIPKTTWTGRLMRAFNKGWRTRQDCERMFQKCALLNVYPFILNTVTTMRKMPVY